MEVIRGRRVKLTTEKYQELGIISLCQIKPILGRR
jgi:hypothetical protein